MEVSTEEEHKTQEKDLEEEEELTKRTNYLNHFWYDIQRVVSSSQDGSMMRDMAMLDYLFDSPPTDNGSNEEERKV